MSVDPVAQAVQYVDDGYTVERAAHLNAVSVDAVNARLAERLAQSAAGRTGTASQPEPSAGRPGAPSVAHGAPVGPVSEASPFPVGSTVERPNGTKPQGERAGTNTVRPAIELDAFLAQPDPEYDWLIPGLIERGDRVILTGVEGQGKSTLLRQVGVQAASGIHPFGGDAFTPLRVLFVDVENGARHVRREMRKLRIVAGDAYQAGMLHIECRPEGIDLNSEDGDDGRWLLDLARHHTPDLLIVGPLYKLAAADPTEERPARLVAMWLDKIRTEAGCALVMEAHTPHGRGDGGKRPERPYGASLWLRWPEFGIYLSPQGHLRHWRGQRDERAWPAALDRGGAWPWTPVTRERDLIWARVVEECGKEGKRLSYAVLAKRLGTATASVQRAVNEHRTEWDAMASTSTVDSADPLFTDGDTS